MVDLEIQEAQITSEQPVALEVVAHQLAELPVLAVLLLLPVKVIMAAQVQPMVHHGDLVVVVVAPVQREELLLEHHLLAQAALVFHLACQELLLIMPAGAPANHGQVQVRLLH